MVALANLEVSSSLFRPIIAASLLAAASPIIQVHFSPLVDPKVAVLRDEALTGDHYAWDIVEGLTTEVGPRLAGTEAEARAREWAVKRLNAMGFANVRVEPFDMPVWVRGHESAEIIAPFPQPMVIAALGNSGSTGAEGITGDIVAFDSVDALRARPTNWSGEDRVRGCHASQLGGSGYGQLARRAARADRRLAEAPWRLSSGRSEPTVTATRIPAS